jgi:hypothetical protein
VGLHAEQQLPPVVVDRALETILAQDSRAYMTPSGATLDLVTDLVRAQTLGEERRIHDVHGRPPG